MLKDLFRRYIWLVDTVYRAESLNLTENKFVLPKDFDAEAYLYNSFGIIVYDGSPAETIRLTVKGNISGLFRCIIRRKKWKFAGNIPYSSISYPRPLISSRKSCRMGMRSRCLLRNIFAMKWQR